MRRAAGDSDSIGHGIEIESISAAVELRVGWGRADLRGPARQRIDRVDGAAAADGVERPIRRSEINADDRLIAKSGDRSGALNHSRSGGDETDQLVAVGRGEDHLD